MSKSKRKRKSHTVDLSAGDAVLAMPWQSGLTLDLADPSKLTFRKKILPLGTINYPVKDPKTGRTVRTQKIVMDRAYHQTLIEAHKGGAYPHATLQLADKDNAHNELPERAAAQLVDLGAEQPGDTDGPGLYATVKAFSKKHARMLRQNPNLGVSPRIQEGVVKVDGRTYPRAVRHVLATIAPRVDNLGPWRPVSLSEKEAGNLIDLSDATVKEFKVPKAKDKSKAKTVDLSDDEIEAALADAFAAVDAGGVDLADGGTGGGYVDLAAELDNVRDELDGTRRDLAAESWAKQRAEFALAGVPKSDLDLAEPWLSTIDNTVVDLSDADGKAFQADPRDTIRALLENHAGTVDLSDAEGYSDSPDDDDDGVTELSEAWDKRSGSVDTINAE